MQRKVLAVAVLLLCLGGTTFGQEQVRIKSGEARITIVERIDEDRQVKFQVGGYAHLVHSFTDKYNVGDAIARKMVWQKEYRVTIDNIEVTCEVTPELGLTSNGTVFVAVTLITDNGKKLYFGGKVILYKDQQQKDQTVYYKLVRMDRLPDE